MSTVAAKIIDRVIAFTERPLLYSHAKNVDYLHVTFDDEWTGYTKTAVFYRTIEKPFAVLMDDDTCIIPPEVMEEDGKIFIGVFGVKDDKVLNSEVVFYPVGVGALTEGAVPEPTPGLWQDILNKIDLIKNTQDQAGEVLKEAQQTAEEINKNIDVALDASETATAAAETATAKASEATEASQEAQAAKTDAESAKESAEQAKIDAEKAKQSAETSAEEAAQSADSASQSATTAQNEADTATEQAGIATEKANEASASANAASDDATSASESAAQASQSASSATQSATDATNAKNDAQEWAEQAEQSATDAENARTEAVNAKTSAVSAKTDAETARDEAVEAAENAQAIAGFDPADFATAEQGEKADSAVQTVNGTAPDETGNVTLEITVTDILTDEDIDRICESDIELPPDIGGGDDEPISTDELLDILV